jgi:hypothetical protein
MSQVTAPASGSFLSIKAQLDCRVGSPVGLTALMAFEFFLARYRFSSAISKKDGVDFGRPEREPEAQQVWRHLPINGR